MNNDVFFTIGIPAYKIRFLKECIDSILNQTYQKFELIIVNDYSPDSIKDLVDTYNDERIRYYVNEANIGAENVIENWNKCLNHAKGDYFVLMGDDDKMEVNYLEEFIFVIGRFPGLDVYHCRSKIIDENSNTLRLSLSSPEYESTYNFIWHCLTGKREQYISDFVYKTSKLKEINGFYKLPLAWISDYVTAFIASGNKGIAHIYKPVFNYRTSGYNITSTGSIDLKRKAVIGFESWLMEFIKNEDICYEDKLIYPALLEAIENASLNYKFQFIKQKILTDGFNGFISCLKYRKEYLIKTSDVFSTLLTALNTKLVKYNYKLFNS